MLEQIKTANHELILVDEQLVLRSVTETEAGEFFSLTDHNREYLAEFLPWVDRTLSVQDSLNFIKQVKEQRLEGSQYGFVIYYNNELVGHISLMHITDEASPEIGYWIAKDSSGRGVTTKATEAVQNFGFDIVKLNEIVIKARIENNASNAIAKKLGYTLQSVDQREDETLNIWRRTNEQQ